jgi:hypothetical protein
MRKKRTREDLINSLPDSFKPTDPKPLSHYMPKPKQVSAGLSSDEGLSEDQVIAKCIPYLKRNGWVCKRIYTGGIPTPSGGYVPNPAKGIPDFICFHIESKKMVWIEFKKSKGGLISQEQTTWHKLLELCGQKVIIVNSLSKLMEELIK